ncbi:Glycoside hydrolase/deacetylase beta/alpha-barrel [Penicillium hispanicum]|uniref:Glycoside hydrolase/deacetylase beta/alpha-barrel n=1 Tax=Penicillium hispanicum TaxID=1080232 RepID=UPI002540EB13|nr:Glycoside hydrolase/deacetylase beta/alpha-barrel [Penicillium hispanicum]KAJ5594349.1 Glycoside hydrolase/deacetylase beta/alpha-barrel [Penicillium hispanicum]
MQLRSFLPASSALSLVLLLPTATSFVHNSIEHSHWFETRANTLATPQSQSSMPSLVIDTFQNPTHNDLGFWHGAGENLAMHHEPGILSLFPTDPDQNFHTQFDTKSCFSLLPWQNHFLHVVFEGTDQFTVSLNEHNADCYPRRSPFPGIPDSVQASRYMMRTKPGTSQEDDSGDDGNEGASVTRNSKQQHPKPKKCEDGNQDPSSQEKAELFIPLSHFHIDHSRVMSVSFTGFYTNESLTLRRVELVSTIPAPSPSNGHFKIPEKLPSGKMVLRCSRPNSFAFGIDDGQPQYAQEVLRILDEEDVRATFFVVGTGLRDPSTNFTRFYQEMLQRGHQVAFHSNTHPKMEGLPSLEKIDEEITSMMQVFQDNLGIKSSYFRPPFGTVGARLRQQLAKYIPNPYIVNWSVDVEDWLWANTSTPEKQLDAFYRDVARGGNLAVMHYLHPTTVGYLRQFIQHAKRAGFKVMRIDQCVEDPSSPPI